MNSPQAPKPVRLTPPHAAPAEPQVTHAYEHMRCYSDFDPSPNKYARLMDEALIRARLAQVEWHISVGERAIARQRDIIAKAAAWSLLTPKAPSASWNKHRRPT